MGLSVRTKTALMYAVGQQLKVMALTENDPKRADEELQLTFHIAAVERELPEDERKNATTLIQGVANGVATRTKQIKEAAPQGGAAVSRAVQDYVDYLRQFYNLTALQLTLQAREVADRALANKA